MDFSNQAVFSTRVAAFAVVAALAVVFPATTFGQQGSTQIVVMGAPPTLPSPFLGELVSDYRSGLYSAQFIYSSPSSVPTSFRLHVTIDLDGRRVVDIESDPATLEPGVHTYRVLTDDPPFLFNITDEEFLAAVRQYLPTTVERGGILPEGTYVLTMQLVPTDPAALIVAVPSVTVFNVSLADPPVLFTPSDRAIVNQEYPLFAWTAVYEPNLATVEYVVRIVEIRDFQTPLQAIESNRVHAEVVVGQNTFQYSPTSLPFEGGRTYAWQVTARDPEGFVPFTEAGRSLIHTFEFDPRARVSRRYAEIGDIVIEPGFAKITRLEDVRSRPGPSSFTLDGPAILELETTPPTRASIDLRALEIQNVNLENPVVLGGEFSARSAGRIRPPSEQIALTDLRWSMADGLTVGASFDVPDQPDLRAAGRLRLTRSGFAGTLVATGDPILNIGTGAVSARVDEIRATFPSGAITASGEVRLFGGASGCRFEGVRLSDDEFEVPVNCVGGQSIELFGSANPLLLEVSRLRGTIRPDASEDTGAFYDLALTGVLKFSGEDDRQDCGVEVGLRLTSQDGLSTDYSRSTCWAAEFALDLGAFEAVLRRVNLEQLDFDSDGIQASLTADVTLRSTALPGLELPEIGDVVIDESGFRFPQMNLGGPDFPDVLVVRMLRLAMESFSMPSLVHPYFDWDRTGDGPWDYEFRARARWTDEDEVPACLRDAHMGVHGVQTPDDRLAVAIDADDVRECRIPVGPVATVVVENFSGALGAYIDPDTTIADSWARVNGRIEWNDPFQCDAEQNLDQTTAPTEFEFMPSSGGVSGRVTDVHPACPLRTGPLLLSVTSSELVLDGSTREQRASLAGAASLQVNESLVVDGTFRLNVATGEFEELSFDLNRPFTWSLPPDEPVLTFEVDAASISEDGFLVDGAQELVLDDQAVAVDFDSLLVDLERGTIESGSATIEGEFALEVGVDEASLGLAFASRSATAGRSFDSGFLVRLSPGVTVDSEGLHAAGLFDGELAFGGEEYTSDFAVLLSNDFAVGFGPPRIIRGRADLEWQDVRIAYADADGFHPDVSFLADALLPDRIPLPMESVAYLQIRDGDVDLVTMTEEANGVVRINSNQNGPRLIVPALDPSDPPTLANVTLEDVRVRMSNGSPEIIGGSIVAEVPESVVLAEDFPAAVTSVAYETRTTTSGPTKALFVDGTLILFGADTDVPVSLIAHNDGSLRGIVDVADVDVAIPLVPNSNAVMLRIEQIQGDLAVGPAGASADLEIDSRLAVESDDVTIVDADIAPRWDGEHLVLSEFAASAAARANAFDLGPFGMRIDSLAGVADFGYAGASGWSFRLDIDASLAFELGGDADGPLVVPIRSVEVSESGVTIPPQDISRSTVPGLNLPAVQLAGFELKPLALRTATPFVFDWTSGFLSTPAVSLDLALSAPALDSYAVLPSDGLTIRDATFSDGAVEGSIEPVSWIQPPRMPVAVVTDAAPWFHVNEVSGDLRRGADGSQQFDVRLDGELADLPGFDADACPAPPAVSLMLASGRGLSGTVENVAPCGVIPLGPVGIEFQSADLAFAYSNDAQTATLDGTAVAELPSPDPDAPPARAVGNLGVDILSGSITSGEIRITDPFMVGLPSPTAIAAFPDVCKLTASDGLLNAVGLLMNGSGTFSTGEDGASASLDLNDLLVSWDTGEISAGSATIGAELDLLFALNPLGFELVAPSDPAPADDHVLVSFDSDVTLDSDGLGFTGSATANIVFADQEFASLNVLFEDNFRMRPGAFAVNSGRVAMYVPAEPDEPLATIDANGFSIGGAVVALLPARIGLPTQDIAYVVTRDAQDVTLLDVGDTQSGGHTLSTRAPIDLVIPALDSGNGPPVVSVEFELTTDASFNVRGGSITLASPLDLEPSVGLPVLISSLGVANESGPVELELGLAVDLPDALGDHDLVGDIRLSRDGPTGTLTLGDPDAPPSSPPVSSFTFGSATTGVTVAVTSAIVELGVAPRLAINGSFGSTYLNPDGPSVFWKFGVGASGPTFEVELPGDAVEIDLGDVTFALAGDEPLTADLTDDRFVVSFDGIVDFGGAIGEPLEVAIDDLEVGVESATTSPSIRFGIGGASAVGDLSLSLFDGAAELDVDGASVAVDADGVAITATGGDLTFLENEISFSEFRMGTDGGFSVGELDAADVQLVGEYVVLESVGFSNTNGLRLDAAVRVSLPEPVDATSEATISVRRNAYGAVVVESSDAAFDLNTDIPLGDFGTFRLTAAAVDLDVFDPLRASVKAAGRVRVGNRDVLWFGDAGDLKNKPGIEYSNLLGLRYNVTGAVNFEVEHSFFRIVVEADAVASSDDAFAVELGGSASIMIDGVGGSVGYEGLTVTSDGVQDYGNIVAPAQVTLMEFATLDIGRFQRVSSETGVDVDVPVGFDATPSELTSRAGRETPTRSVRVTEYLCFGPCGANTSADALRISLGGQSSNNSGGFSGGVGEILFYRTTDEETYLLVRDVNLQLDEILTMSASMEYAQGSDGFSLRVVAGGSFDVEGFSAEAALAGTIRNKNGQLSFGLFVAASASAGIPIVPGVVELTGAGGGFFYRPTSGDLATVTGPSGALAAFGYQPLQQPKTASDINFAVMLFAQAGIAGSAGNYAVEGKAFLQITDQSIFLDAQGSVLGFDGSGNLGATATAGFYVEANRDPFLVEAGVKVDIEVPVYVSGNLDVELFIARINNETVWGVLGNGEIGFINNIITATGQFAACNDGFLVQAALELGLDLPVIKVESTIEGAIWLMAIPEAQYPLGAYVTFDARVCAGVCVGIGAEAALVTRRPSGFMLFAAVRAYTSIGGEIRAWASISDDGVRGGLGRGEHGDLIAELKQQADDFVERVEGIAQSIQDARDELERAEAEKQVDHGVPPEVVARAGANFHLSDRQSRSAAASDILANEERHVNNLPNEALNFVAGFVLAPDPSRPELEWASLGTAEQEADTRIASANDLIDDVRPRLAEAAALAVAYEQASEDLLDEYVDAIASNPLQSFSAGAFDPVAGESPSFSIDQQAAAEQAAGGEAAAEAAAAADAQVLEAIDTITLYLREIDQLISFQLQIDIDEALDFQDDGPGPVTITSQPGVSDAMREYQRAVEASDRYYALAADIGWRTRGWAQRRLSELTQRRSGIQAGLQSLYASASTAANRKFQSRERVRALHELAGSGNLNADLQRHDAAFDQNPQTEYTTVGMQLWFDMHTAGLDTLAEASARTSMATVQQAHAASQDIRGAQGGVAARADEVYQLRGLIAANLYNLVDSYLDARESTDADDPVTIRLEETRERLLDELVPPTLSGITVAPNLIGYRNETTISWTASHPVGIAEVSYAVEREGASGPATSLNYVTAGNASQVHLHATKGGYARANSPTPESSYETQRYTVGVRVRGRGGRTAERSASFEIAVGPGSEASDSGDDIVVADDTAPPAPRILLGENYGYTTLINPQTSKTERRYWTDDGQALDLVVQAYDLESDISIIEYAIGSERGATDVESWTPLEGNRMRVNGVEGFPVVQMIGSTRPIGMTESQPYYVSIRATNGEGLVSAVTRADGVSYDATPPTSPNPLFVFHPLILPPYMFVPVQPPVDGVPGYTDPYFTNDNWLNVFASTTKPEVKVGWQASSDPESQVRRYEVDNSAHRDSVDFGPQPRTTTATQYDFKAVGYAPYSYAAALENDFTARYVGAVTSYRDTLFVHVRAQNNARSYSDVMTVARVPRDPTVPIRPYIAARVDGDHLRVYLTTPAYDFESGVAGLQWAAGTSAGEADLRSWPSGIDFEWSNTQSLAENFVPDNPDNCVINCDQTRSSFDIPLSQLPQATSFYLSLRAVNSQGSASAPAASGPFVVDATPPVIGGVTLTDNGDGTVTIRASSVRDPESGVQSVEYRLKDAYDPFKGTAWATLFPVYTSKAGISGQRTVSIAGYSKSSLRVGVRVTSGAGRQTTVWSQFPLKFEF